MNERQLAIQQQRAIEERALAYHNEMVALAHQNSNIVDEARRRVALWEQRKTCHPWYVEEWKSILDGNWVRVLEDSDSARALRQNSPF